MARREQTSVTELEVGGVLVFSKAGAPTNGASGTGAGRAAPGSLCIDTTNKKLYQNTNTKASPTWGSIGDIAVGEITAAAGTVLVGTKTTGVASAVDMSAAGALIIGQGAAETPAAAAMSGDVKMDKTGATTIQAGAVEASMVALAAGSVFGGTKTTNVAVAVDISAEGAMVLGQGAGETPAAAAMSGDVTMTKAGVTAIGSAKVTSAMLANGAGLAAVITAGLGNSVSYVKTDDGAKTILAANASKTRGVLVVGVVDEAFADAGGSQTVIEIGEEGTIDKGMDHTVLAGASKGAIFCRGFANTSTKAVIATVTKAVTTGTGGASFAVLALPDS